MSFHRLEAALNGPDVGDFVLPRFQQHGYLNGSRIFRGQNDVILYQFQSLNGEIEVILVIDNMLILHQRYDIQCQPLENTQLLARDIIEPNVIIGQELHHVQRRAMVDRIGQYINLRELIH